MIKQPLCTVKKYHPFAEGISSFCPYQRMFLSRTDRRICPCKRVIPIVFTACLVSAVRYVIRL